MERLPHGYYIRLSFSHTREAKEIKKKTCSLSLFEDHIIVYVENAIEFTKALLELVSDFW